MREANMAAPYMAMNVGGKRRKFAFFLTSETARPFRAELPELWPRLSEEVTDRIVEQTPGRHDRHLSKPEPPSRPSRGTPGTVPIPFAASFVFSAAPDDWAKVSPPGTWPTAFCESQSESRE